MFIAIVCKTSIHFVFEFFLMMASADCTIISSNELFKTQINALIQMKIDFEKQKKKFIETQTKYHQ